MEYIKTIFGLGENIKKEHPPVPNDKRRDEMLIDGQLIKKNQMLETIGAQRSPVNFKKMVNLKMETKYDKIKNSTDPQTIPVLLSLIPNDTDLGNQRMGLDLVMVNDISGSMGGEKIKLLVETLLFVIEQLQDCDRLSVVAFDDDSEILTSLTLMTPESKEHAKKIVLGKIISRCSTNIKKGLIEGYEVFLNRKEINDVSAMFLLSDGQDTCGNDLQSFEATLKEYDEKMNEKGMAYKINSFGYGEGHDEKVLGLISKYKEGNFYYIKNVQLIDECFIDCLGYLMSIFASQAEITLYMLGKSTIVKKYGGNWSQAVNPSKTTLKIGHIAAGLTRTFVCEIQIPSTSDLKEITVCTSMLNFITEGQNFIMESEFIVPVSMDDDLGQIHNSLEENLVRVKAAEILKQAEQEYKKGNRAQANEEIENFKASTFKNHHLSSEYQQKIDALLKNDIFEDYKDVVENFEMLERETYKPGKENIRSMNMCQVLMNETKKG